MAHAQHSSFRPMAEVPFHAARQLSEYKGKRVSASREHQGQQTQLDKRVTSTIFYPEHFRL